MSTAPRELKGFCIIGGVNAPEGGHLSGHYARTRTPKDPSNIFPQNYYSRQQGDDSKLVTAVTQGSNQLLLPVNTGLLAPMCTFAFGGIAPGETHPQLNLVKGPPSTITYEWEGTTQRYKPSFANEANFSTALGSSAGTPVQGPNSSLSAYQYPFIPSYNTAIAVGAEALTTFNIWQIRDLDTLDPNKLITYTKNVGPEVTARSGYQGPFIRQVAGADGSMALMVNSQDTQFALERIFPISMDLAYTSDTNAPQLFYPPVNGTLHVAPQKIRLKGSENCGFQLRFHHSPVNAVANPNTNRSTGGMQIFWGNLNGSTANDERIKTFCLELVPNSQPILWYRDPRVNGAPWREFPITGPEFGNGGEYSVYVHFAGTNMYIGFSPDPTDWNCFMPLTHDLDPRRVYYPRIPKDSRINVVFSHITTRFEYGPIGFLNYDSSRIKTQDDINYRRYLANIGTSLVVPNDPRYYQAEGEIRQKFFNLRYRSEDTTPFDDMESAPTHYADWRTDLSDGRKSEFWYTQESVTLTSTRQDVEIKGRVFFNTTIEGPMFSHILSSRSGEVAADGSNDPGIPPTEILYNNTPTTVPVASNPLVSAVPWGDVSRYLEDWTVDYTLEDTGNRSILAGTATIVLRNLANNPRGQQILTLLRENRPTITVGGGYETSNVFFQGILESSSTRYTNEGTITTLKCRDIATKMLSDLRFGSYVYMIGCKYETIIDRTMRMSGLHAWYERSSDPTLTKVLSFRMGNFPIDPAFANSPISVGPKTTIMKALKNVLELVLDDNTLPIFFWDPVGGRFRLEVRTNPSYTDELFFVGEKSVDNTVALPSDMHGVLTEEGYTIDTVNDQLYAGLVLYGQSFYADPIRYIKYFQTAWGNDAFNKFYNAIGNKELPPPLGYTGYRCLRLHETVKNFLPDQLALQQYGTRLAKAISPPNAPYEGIRFSCLVTQPLQVIGQFRISTFAGASTDKYFYSNISYQFKKKEGTITAEVSGERAVPVIFTSPGDI